VKGVSALVSAVYFVDKARVGADHALSFVK